MGVDSIELPGLRARVADCSCANSESYAFALDICAKRLVQGPRKEQLAFAAQRYGARALVEPAVAAARPAHPGREQSGPGGEVLALALRPVADMGRAAGTLGIPTCRPHSDDYSFDRGSFV